MIGLRIKEERIKRGLSQEELSKIVSVTQQAVNKWEHGKSHPDLETIKTLASLFNCSTDYLLNRTEERRPATLVQEELTKYTTKESQENFPFLTDLFLKVPDLTEDEKDYLYDHVEFLIQQIIKKRQRAKEKISQ